MRIPTTAFRPVAATAAAPAVPAKGLRGALRAALRWLDAARATRRQRLHLGRLDDRLLADIGLTRAQAEAEADRPAWEAPAHWRR